MGAVCWARPLSIGLRLVMLAAAMTLESALPIPSPLSMCWPGWPVTPQWSLEAAEAARRLCTAAGMSCPRCLAWLKLLVAGPIKALLGRSTHALVNWTVTVIIAVIGPIQDSGAEGASAAPAPSVCTATTEVRAGLTWLANQLDPRPEVVRQNAAESRAIDQDL